MYKNEKEQKSCHYRDCKAITDNLGQIKREINVMPILPRGKIRGIFKLNKRSGRSLEFFRFLRKNRDDALLFLASPRTRFSEIATSAFRLLAMTPTTLTLAVVLSVGIASKALAECVGATETTAGTDAVSGAHCGICGTNCNWKIEGDTLKVTGGANGEIGHMNNGATTINNKYTYVMPWKGLNNEFSKVDIQGVENVGNSAFRGFNNITDIKLSDSITKIGEYAFSENNVKNIVLPDSITTIGLRAFSGVLTNPTSLQQLIIPDSVSLIGDSAFGANNEQLQNLEIICKGEKTKCAQVLSGYSYYDYDDGTAKYVPVNLAKHMNVADYEYCNSTNYFWDGANCIREPDVTKRKCCDSCKDMGGYCNRIRYTPAEAAEVLHDDNTNSVTITFKK